MTFEKLKKILEIQVQYRTLGALAIHASKDAPFEATDAPVVKIGGKPVIPGSSLKGVLRSTLESTMSAEGVSVCVPAAAIPRAPKNTDRDRFAQDYVRGLGRKMSCSVADVCPICEIFGTSGDKEGLSGRAVVLDAKSTGEITTIERTHVAIMRDTKSQAGGKLMSLQAVDANTVFNGNIRLINPDDWQVGALIQSLTTINMTGIGSKKTSGYGEIEIKVLGIKSSTLKNGSWVATEAPEKTFTDAYADWLDKREKES
jgi:CRISPR-associated protein Csm3